MQRIESLRRRIQSGEELQSIVRTMKVITAVGIQQFEHAVESLAEYYRTVELGLQVVLSQSYDHTTPFLAADDDRTGIIVFGSSQGLCGPFDETIVDFVQSHLSQNELNITDIDVLGHRAAGYLEHGNLPVNTLHELPGTVAGINETVSRLLVVLERWQTTRNISTVLLFHNKPVVQGRFNPRVQYLLPLDDHWLKRLTERPWPTNNLPQFNMEPGLLFASLLRQYLFVSLYRATAESLAAEYASRLNSMQSAEQKIDTWLQKMETEFRQERHSAITEELLDIMAGFEVVRSETGSK